MDDPFQRRQAALKAEREPPAPRFNASTERGRAWMESLGGWLTGGIITPLGAIIARATPPSSTPRWEWDLFRYGTIAFGLAAFGLSGYFVRRRLRRINAYDRTLTRGEPARALVQSARPTGWSRDDVDVEVRLVLEVFSEAGGPFVTECRVWVDAGTAGKLVPGEALKVRRDPLAPATVVPDEDWPLL